jgi:hypothetical protein
VSIPKRFKAQEGQDRRSEPQGPLDLHVDSISGFRGWKSRKHCNGNRDITKRDIPKAKRICVGPRRSQ